MQDTRTLIARLEHQAHRMGQLWERCQGKGWPVADSREFCELRDVLAPDTRAALEAIEAAACKDRDARIAELERLLEDARTEAVALRATEQNLRKRIEDAEFMDWHDRHLPEMPTAEARAAFDDARNTTDDRASGSGRTQS